MDPSNIEALASQAISLAKLRADLTHEQQKQRRTRLFVDFLLALFMYNDSLQRLDIDLRFDLRTPLDSDGMRKLRLQLQGSFDRPASEVSYTERTCRVHVAPGEPVERAMNLALNEAIRGSALCSDLGINSRLVGSFWLTRHDWVRAGQGRSLEVLIRELFDRVQH